MESPFVSEATVRVDIGEGQWIEIKEAISHADYGAIQQATLRGLVKGELRAGEQPSFSLSDDLSLDAGSQVMVLRCLRAWSFSNGAGPVPINAESLARLRQPIWERIIEAMNRQYAAPDEAQKKG